MIIFGANDVSLSFGTTPILEKVSFALEETDKLGIIGVNGCGKSSLFRLITGEYEPTEGSFYFSKGKTLGILTQEGAFDCNNENETVLTRMYNAFPHLLSAEKRLAELENAMKTGNDTAAIASYTALHEKYVREGGTLYATYMLGILKTYRKPLGKITVGSLIVCIMLGVCAVNFVMFYPAFAGIPVPEWLAAILFGWSTLRTYPFMIPL